MEPNPEAPRGSNSRSCGCGRKGEDQDQREDDQRGIGNSGCGCVLVSVRPGAGGPRLRSAALCEVRLRAGCIRGKRKIVRGNNHRVGAGGPGDLAVSEFFRRELRPPVEAAGPASGSRAVLVRA
ncbi:hypothetical protein GCM10009609_15410 [Pseudonocardia aurantiaca]